MNHDVTHCNGLDCPRQDTCLRYKAHLELISPPARQPEPEQDNEDIFENNDNEETPY